MLILINKMHIFINKHIETVYKNTYQIYSTKFSEMFMFTL